MAALLLCLTERRSLRRQRVFRDRTNILDTLNDTELISRYRFPRHTILEISDQIEDITRRPTNRTCPIPNHIQVMATLRYIGKADFFLEIGDIHGISKSSVSRIIHRVCSAINLCMKNITFDTDPLAIRKVKEDFYKIAAFPNVLGAIDGTLIPIMGMSGDEEHVYVCRKGFHAVNVQAIVDANMRFTSINAKFPGSTHDAYILSNSGVPSLMEGLADGGWLLGDSGYPLKDWLLTPFISPSNRKQQGYNTAHGKTRTVVERTFGVLKSRFRCLHKSGGSLPFTPIKCSRIIETCFRLHNKAVEEKIPLLQGGSIINISNGAALPDQPSPSAQQRRLRVADRF